MSKPREFFIAYDGDKTHSFEVFEEVREAIKYNDAFGGSYIRVREVTAQDKDTELALNGARRIITMYYNEHPDSFLADNWLKKYDDPEGTTNE